MPASTLTVPPRRSSATSEPRSARALVTQATRINRHAQDVLEAERHLAQAQTTLSALRTAHPDLVHLHSSSVVRYVVYLFAIVCVYILDLLLFGNVGEYVASLISGVPTIVVLAKYGFPLFFLGLEIAIATKILEAREEVSAYEW